MRLGPCWAAQLSSCGCFSEHLATITMRKVEWWAQVATPKKAVASKSERWVCKSSMGLRHYVFRSSSNQIGSAADWINSWQPDRLFVIISQPGTIRAEEETLVVATVRVISKVAHNSHHSILLPADIPTGGMIEDRYMDLGTNRK